MFNSITILKNIYYLYFYQMEWKSLKLGMIFPKIKNVSEKEKFQASCCCRKNCFTLFSNCIKEHKVGQRDFVDKAGERLAARLDRDRGAQVCCIEL